MSAPHRYAYTQFMREKFCPSITAPALVLFRHLPRKGEVPAGKTELDIMKGCVIFRLYNCRAEGRIRDTISYRRGFTSYDLFCPQVDGANALTNMAKALATTFKSVRADNITKNILIGLNFVLDAAVATSSDIKREQGSSEIRDWIDDSNEARNKDHQEKVTIWSISKRPLWSDTLAILISRC